jgi:hypothetical protein
LGVSLIRVDKPPILTNPNLFEAKSLRSHHNFASLNCSGQVLVIRIKVPLKSLLIGVC